MIRLFWEEKFMRNLFLASIFGAAFIAPALAQPMPPAAAKTFTSSAEVQQLIAKAKADRKGDAPTTIEPILAFGTYHANLEYRPIAGPAALHDTENEVVYVIEGSATITMGGQMVNPTRPNPANQAAASISGGSDTAIGKGDFIMVPHGTPHQITAVKDGPLVLMTLHMPQ
jgi:mannose-6-phosphate isomerase-like protein (cupin superfamily)